MTEKTTKPGIYAITHIASGKVYVGSSANIQKRWSQHRGDLRKGRHKNPHLQAAWSLYGETAFEFTVLEEVWELTALPVAEQAHIDRTGAMGPSGYNVCIAGGSRLGIRHSPATCAKIGASKIGNKNRMGATLSPESREAIRQKLIGRKAATETIAKLSAMRRGRKKSPEHIAKMVASRRATIAARVELKLCDRSGRLLGRGDAHGGAI